MVDIGLTPSEDLEPQHIDEHGKVLLKTHVKSFEEGDVIQTCCLWCKSFSLTDGQWTVCPISLSEDSCLTVFYDDKTDTIRHQVILKEVIDVVAFGAYTTGMPRKPPGDLDLPLTLAVPVEPNINGHIVWIAFSEKLVMNRWLLEIARICGCENELKQPGRRRMESSTDYETHVRGMTQFRPATRLDLEEIDVYNKVSYYPGYATAYPYTDQYGEVWDGFSPFCQQIYFAGILREKFEKPVKHRYKPVDEDGVKFRDAIEFDPEEPRTRNKPFVKGLISKSTWLENVLSYVGIKIADEPLPRKRRKRKKNIISASRTPSSTVISDDAKTDAAPSVPEQEPPASVQEPQSSVQEPRMSLQNQRLSVQEQKKPSQEPFLVPVSGTTLDEIKLPVKKKRKRPKNRQ